MPSQTAPDHETDVWLAGLYERNIDGETLAGMPAIVGARRFASPSAIHEALGIEVIGDRFSTQDPADLAHAATALGAKDWLKISQYPGRVALFIHHLPQARGASYLTYTIDDGDRATGTLCGALTPAVSLQDAVERFSVELESDPYLTPEEDLALEALVGLRSASEQDIAAARAFLLQGLDTVAAPFMHLDVSSGNRRYGIISPNTWNPVPHRHTGFGRIRNTFRRFFTTDR